MPSSTTTAIDILNTDILYIIFDLCLPTWCTASPTSPPLSLSRVCSRWRTAVYQNPRLWTSLVLDCEKEKEEKGLGCPLNHTERKFIARANHWFKHAHRLPVRLHVECKCLPSRVNLGFVESILAPFASRISHLHILGCRGLYDDSTNYPTVLPLLRLPAETFAELQCLKVDSRGRGNSTVDLSQWSILGAKNLRKVQLYVVDTRDTISKYDPFLQAPIPQRTGFTHLELTLYIPQNRWLRLLASCPMLERIVVTMRKDSTIHPSGQSSEAPAAPLTMHHLRSVAIDFVDDCGIAIFNNIHLPSLRNLIIRGAFKLDFDKGDIADLSRIHFLRQIQHLTSLSLVLSPARWHPSAGVDIFLATTELTALVLKVDFRANGNILTALTRIQGQTAASSDKLFSASDLLLPQLRTLVLSIPDVKPDKRVPFYDRLKNMIESRRGGPNQDENGMAPLRNVKLYIPQASVDHDNPMAAGSPIDRIVPNLNRGDVSPLVVELVTDISHWLPNRFELGKDGDDVFSS